MKAGRIKKGVEHLKNLDIFFYVLRYNKLM